MAFHCPYCRFPISVKNPKAGRHTPRCPKCRRPFGLVVPDDLQESGWQVSPLPAEGAGDTTPVFQQPSPESTTPTGKYQPVERRGDGTRCDDPTAPGTPPSAVPTGRYPNVGAGDRPGAGGGEETSPPVEPTKPHPPRTQRDAVRAAADRTRGEETAPASAPTRPEESPDRSPSAPKVRTKRRPADRVTGQTEHEIPARLGGYELVRELGRGGMGTVFLARQVSLDRPVALKVMNPRWARDPAFAARFTREAYAAAQLVHHNVVQIYDMGEQDGTQFFSMEYVEGTSLGDLVRKKGELKPLEAAGYALQAARGLRFAHERGMVHRDVKPDNLLLNAHGVVKVADLGLVKTPTGAGSGTAPAPSLPAASDTGGSTTFRPAVTDAFSAMGSPAYMAPEQCRDAASVDARADIYSLGCTLYVLLTGRPPFQGSTALELMSQHVTKAPAPPDAIVHGVPTELSAIVLKMMAKAPEERQPDMGAVVGALEAWMGVRHAGRSGPGEEHLALLERSVRAFNAAPAARLRKPSVAGFFAVTLLGFAGALALGKGRAAGGFLTLLVTAPLAHFVISGVARRTYLFGKARELAYESRFSDWALGLVGILLLAGVLALLGLFWAGLGFAAAGVGLASAYYFAVDRRLADQRQPALEEAETLLKRLRLQGSPEEEIRLFVARFSGRHWEEFFEELFGFEARRAAREEVAREGGAPRERFARWRDPVADRLDGIIRARREAKERRYLQAVEARRLKAEGVNRREAEERAAAAADVLVEQAAVIKAARTVGPGATVAGSRAFNVRQMLEGAEGPAARPRRRANPLAFAANILLGPRARFLLAAALIAGGALWVRQNLHASATEADAIDRSLPEMAEALLNPEPAWPPLRSSVVPSDVTDWFDHANALLAGALLLASLFYRGPPAFLILAGAAVAFAGHRLGLPGVDPVRPYQAAMIAGTVLATLGFLVARRRGGA